MSDSLWNEIEKQMKESKYQIVSDTHKRLMTLNLSDDQVHEYLIWAYQNALNQKGELDDERYFQNLNQLPLINDSPKMIKSLTIEDALKMLNELLVQQQSSLSEIVVNYWYANLLIDDGYETKVRILDKVRPNELADVLAIRDGITELDDIEIVLETEGNSVILNEFQADEAIDELLEENDILRYYFRDEAVKFELQFTHKSSQTFHAIESVLSE